MGHKVNHYFRFKALELYSSEVKAMNDLFFCLGKSDSFLGSLGTFLMGHMWERPLLSSNADRAPLSKHCMDFQLKG